MESLDGVVAESKTQSDHWDHPMLYLEPGSTYHCYQKRGLWCLGEHLHFLSRRSRKVVSDRHLCIFAFSRMVEHEPIGSVPVFDESVDWKGKASPSCWGELVQGGGLLEEDVESARLVVMGDVDWVSNGMLEENYPMLCLQRAVLGWMMDSTETKITKYRTRIRF